MGSLDCGPTPGNSMLSVHRPTCSTYVENTPSKGGGGDTEYYSFSARFRNTMFRIPSDLSGEIAHLRWDMLNMDVRSGALGLTLQHLSPLYQQRRDEIVRAVGP